MAAILKLRRGTTIPSLVQSELFYHTSNDILVVGDGSSHISIVKIGSNTGSIEFTGAVTASSISSSGDVIANNISASNLDLTGNAVIDGNITLGGNIFLGDQIADNINVTGQFSGSLIPSASNQYDLGSSVKKWRNLWVVSASIDDLTVDGSGILSSSVTDFVTFSSSVDSRLDSAELTGSDHESRIDTIETTFSSSVDSRLDDLELTGSNHEDRLDTIETTFSSSVDSRLDLLELTGSDHESRLDTLETTFSSSVDTRLDNLESTGSDHESRIDEIETTFSSSVDTRLDELETFSQSLDNEFLNTNGDSVVSGSDQVTASLDLRYLEINGDNVISSSAQILDGSGILSSSNENFTTFSSSIDSRVNTLETTFSSSVDSRLDELEGNFSSSVDSQLNGLYTYTSSLKNSIEVSGANLTVLGNLTVQGTQTSLNTNDLIVEDKLIAIASGSTSSATSDGAGLFISGASASMTWNHSDSLLEFNTKISSSVGFKGDGSEVTDIQHGNVDFGGSDIISGSSQVTQSLDLRYLEINGDSVVSSSQQISNYNTFLEINGDSVVSSSQQISNYGIFAELNGDNLLSSSQQISNYGIFAELNGDNLVSSSQQVIGHLPSGIVSGSTFTDLSSSVDSRLDTLEGPFSTSVDSRLDLLENFSSSEYIADSSSFDDRLDSIQTFTESIDGRVSTLEGSSHSHSNKSNLDTINQNLSTTSDVSFNTLSLGNVITDSSVLNALFLSSSDEIVYRGLGSAAFVHYSQSIDDGNPSVIGTAGAVKNYVDGVVISASAGDITEVNAGLGLSGGSTVGPATLTLDTGSTHFIDGVNGVVQLSDGIVSGSDQVTSSLDSRYVNTTGTETIGGDKTFSDNVVVSGNLTVEGTTTTINTSTFNVEDNIIELNYGGSSNEGGIYVKDATGGSTTSGSLLWDSTNDYWKAGKKGIEEKILLANSDGIISQSSQVDASSVSNFDTNVNDYLDSDDVHSGSYLGTATTSDLDEGLNKYYTDARVLSYINGIGVISGSLQLDDLTTLTQFNSYTQSNDGRVNALENWSSSLDSSYVTEGELSTLSQSIDNTILTKLDTGSYNSDSQSFDSRIDTLEGTSNENPLTFSDTTTIDLVRTGDTITANAIGGIISSSIQIDNLGFLQVNGDLVVSSSEQISNYGVFAELNGDSLVSSSQQISDYNTFLEINGDSVVSGSDQVTSSLDLRYHKESDHQLFSQSVDSRIDTLEGTSNESPLTFNDTSTIDLVRTGDTITANAIGGIVSSSQQVKDLGFVDLSSAQTIGGNKTFSDNVIVNGNLTVSGTTTTVNSNTVNIGDNILVLNSDETGTPSQNGGLEIERGTSTNSNLLWDEGNDYWVAGLAGSEERIVIGAGNTSITTLGTISTGTWEGTAIADSYISSATTWNAKLDSAGTIANNDYAKYDANGDLVGRSYSEVKTDLSLNNVENTALSTYTGNGGALDNQYITNGAGYITSFDITTQTDDKYLRSDEDDTASGVITFSNTTNSTSKTTGALKISGGVGIAKTLNVGEDVVAYASSDRRLKENIQPISNPLEKINQISGYSFTWNEDKQNIYKGKDYGVIAQEIEEILPELVNTRENGYKAVKYDKLVSLLIEGIKELSMEVKELKKNKPS